MAAQTDGSRFCPICQQLMDETICPLDGVQTVDAAFVAASASRIEPGTILNDRYRVEARLGGGAMGTVYAATQLSMSRKVALKVLNRETIRDGTELKRFYREAHAASQLKHPNVVGVYEFGVDDASGLPYISMELVEGRTLRELISAGPMSIERTASLLAQVAKALVSAHGAGIIHRDLKPDNMMVSVLPDGDAHVTVLDFGIAKAPAIGPQGESLTASGAVVGTPRYMSPEQARGVEVTAASDLYAFGCILHEMLTGTVPFVASEVAQVMLMHISAPRPTLSLPQGIETPEALRRLHGALLATDPELRPTAAGVARVLRAIVRGTEIADLDAMLSSSPSNEKLDPVPIGPDVGGSGSTITRRRPIDAGRAVQAERSAEPEAPLSPSKRSLLPLFGVVAAGLVGAVVVFATASPPPPPPPVESPPVAVKPPLPTPVLPPPPTAEPEIAPAPKAAPPEQRKVSVRSTPSGAFVVAEGRTLCRTPCQVAVPDEGRTIVLRREGYRTLRKRLTGRTPDTVTFAMSRTTPSLAPY